MTNLEDAYLRANINLADTLAGALVSVNEQEEKPEKPEKPGKPAMNKGFQKEFEKLSASRKNPNTRRAAQAQAGRATARAMEPFGGERP